MRDLVAHVLRIAVERHGERYRASGYEDLSVGLPTDEVEHFVMVHGVPLLKGVNEKVRIHYIPNKHKVNILYLAGCINHLFLVSYKNLIPTYAKVQIFRISHQVEMRYVQPYRLSYPQK